MNTTATAQPLGAATAVQRAPMKPVAAPSSSDPPRFATPVQGAKPPADSVTISDAARLRVADNPPRAQGQGDRLNPQAAGGEMSRAEQIMADLKASFFTRAGEDGFDQKLDFNRDGVINAGDLGVLREKMAGRAMPGEATTPEPPAPPTMGSIRDAFFTRAGDEGFDASADLNGDGIVNVQDLGLYRQSMTDSSQPLQPVPAQVDGTGINTANSASLNTATPLNGQPPGSPIVDEGTVTGPTADAATVSNLTATASEAGSPPVADPSSTRLNLLDQLREAFFSTRGDDRFDATLDANKDGVINVGDFISIRDSV